MFKKILVISDNANVCSRFFEIVKQKQLQGSHFSLAISPFSNPPDFSVSNKVNLRVLNLKNKVDVNFIKLNFDLVFSIHCKQIFPADLVNEVKCINIHPGYNPVNRGWYPQVFSIIHKLPIGATIHEIDEKLDHGAIIDRAFVSKEPWDTSDSLYNKIIDMEIELLNSNLENIVTGKYATTTPEAEGNLFLKKDFNSLLELDLNEQVTVGDFIDKLRALTHGSYDNAYFVDEATGKKIFIGIRLKQE